MRMAGWPDNLAVRWLPLLLVALAAFAPGGAFAASPEPDSPVARYLAARQELDAATDVPPHALASPDPTFRGIVLELRGEIVAIITPEPSAADSSPTCLLLQTELGVTIPLDYAQAPEMFRVGQRVAALARLCDDPQRSGHFVVEHIIPEQDLLAAISEDEAQPREDSGLAESNSGEPAAPGPPADRGHPPLPAAATDLYNPEKIAVWQEWIGRHNPRLSESDRELIVRWVLYHSRDFGVDHRLIFSVILAESSFDPYCVSHAGAQGLMQLMPGTARGLGVEDSFYFPENIRGGVQYLSKYLREYQDKSNYEQCALALACYNAGPNAVKKYGGVPPFSETRRYIVKVTQQFYDLYKAGYP